MCCVGHMDVRNRLKDCRNKKKIQRDNCLTFLTHVALFQHVSYECHTSVKHQRVSDTTIRPTLRSVCAS